MAKIKYDVSDVEEFTPYAGPTPRRGVYDGVVRTAEFSPSKAGNDQFTFTIIIDSKKKDQKEFNGCPLFQNCTIGDLSEDWQKRNLKMVINTFGLKDKGELDPKALVKKLDGKNTRVRVLVKNENSDEYGLQAKANGLLPFKGEDEPEDSDAEDSDADEDADTVDAEDAADDGDEDDGLDEMTRPQLKAFIKEKELEVKVTKSKSDEDIVGEIREALAAAEDDDDDEDDEDDEDETSVEDDIKDLDRAGLKKYIKDNELEVTVKKSWDEDAIRKAIIDAWPDDDDDDDDAADDSEPPF